MSGTTPKKPKMTNEDYAAQFGTQMALVNSVPELSSMFKLAVKEGWTSTTFNAKFQNSKWYKKYGPAYATAESIFKSNKPLWDIQTRDAKSRIERDAATLGVTLTSAQVNALATSTLYLSSGMANQIDSNMLTQHIVETGKISGTAGQAATDIADLKAHARNMGVEDIHSDQWYTNATAATLKGHATLDDYKNQMQENAKSKYGAIADKLDWTTGKTVQFYADPYMRTLDNLWERGPGSTKLTDDAVTKALTSVDTSNKPVMKPLWEFQQWAKSQDPYFKTNQSRSDMLDIANAIGQSFGKI